MTANVTLTLADLHRLTPSVFAETPHERCSDRYQFISTLNLINGLLEEGWYPVSAGQSRARLSDRRNFTRHLLRFRRFDGKLPMVGDTFPEIVLVNSHDGTAAYKLYAGLFRLVCSNGMVIESAGLGFIQRKHTGDALADVIEGTYEIVEELPKIAASVEAFQGIPLEQEEQLAYADSALALRWDGNQPVSAMQVNTPRRIEDQGSSLWTTYQRVQENLTKGGLSGRASTGRRLTTRAITSVDRNVSLNTALWRLTERMAALKTGG